MRVSLISVALALHSMHDAGYCIGRLQASAIPKQAGSRGYYSGALLAKPDWSSRGIEWAQRSSGVSLSQG